jgi:hypothetical protein
MLDSGRSSPFALLLVDLVNDQVELRDALTSLGQTVWETEWNTKAELGVPDAIIVSIGPASASGT